MYKGLLKPLLDWIVAFILLLVFLPIFVFTMLALWISLKGNPFFFQKRPGKNARIFSIVKFRTMSNEKDSQGNLLPDADRLSGFGKLVRSLSLDEIPQLLNVLKGDMSIVGPRPLLPSYLPLYNEFQAKRHEVAPGITGYAQVNGRNSISWEKKFELDVVYVEKISFALDIGILFKTAKKVFLRADISEEESPTMKPFTGTK